MRAKKVAILESRLGAQLADLVAQRGGVPFHAPALAELPDLDPGAIGALLRSLEERPAKAAVFQTGVGTRALFGATDALGLTPKLLEMLSRMVVAVRGPKPTAALRARGVRIDRSAADPFTTREVLECMKDVPVRGERVSARRERHRDPDQSLVAARGHAAARRADRRARARRDGRGGVHQRGAGEKPVRGGRAARTERGAASCAQPHAGRLDRPGGFVGAARGQGQGRPRVEPAETRGFAVCSGFGAVMKIFFLIFLFASQA